MSHTFPLTTTIIAVKTQYISVYYPCISTNTQPELMVSGVGHPGWDILLEDFPATFDQSVTWHKSGSHIRIFVLWQSYTQIHLCIQLVSHISMHKCWPQGFLLASSFPTQAPNAACDTVITQSLVVEVEVPSFSWSTTETANSHHSYGSLLYI